MTNIRAPRAFTIIELLVVIGIILILMAIMVPALRRAKGMSASAKCAATLRQIVEATASYAAEFNRYLPLAGSTSTITYYKSETGPSASGTGYSSMKTPENFVVLRDAGTVLSYGLLYDRGYLKDTSTFYCPTGESHLSGGAKLEPADATWGFPVWGTGVVRMSYFPFDVIQNPEAGYRVPRWKLDQNADLPLFMCFQYKSSSESHDVHGAEGVNVAAGNAAVRWGSSTTLNVYDNPNQEEYWWAYKIVGAR